MRHKTSPDSVEFFDKFWSKKYFEVIDIAIFQNTIPKTYV